MSPIINGQAAACYSRQISKYNNLEKYTREKNYPKDSSLDVGVHASVELSGDFVLDTILIGLLALVQQDVIGDAGQDLGGVHANGSGVQVIGRVGVPGLQCLAGGCKIGPDGCRVVLY